MTRSSNRNSGPATVRSASMPSRFKAALRKLIVRAGRWLLRFLWQQIKWWLWIGGFIAACFVAMYLHYFWIGSILLWIAILIAVGWFMNLINYEAWSGYSEDSHKPRESPIERQQKEVQEDIDRYQREQEDKGQV